jgi:hypothetical protein
MQTALSVNDPELVTLTETDFGKVVALPKAYAHFTNGSKRRPAEVTLSDGPDLSRPFMVQTVSGRREARQIAAKFHAVCWNF